MLSVCSCSWWFLWRFFRIRVVFPLVIHSGIVVSSKHLLSWRSSLSCMDVDFLNQYLCMPSWPGVCQFCIFFLEAIPSVCPSQIDLCVLVNLHHVISPIGFLLGFFFLFHISLQNCFASFASGSCLSPYIIHLLVGRIFLIFWNIPFCLECLTLSRYLLDLSYFTNIFWFISSNRIVRLVCRLILVFSSQHMLACFSFFCNFAYCRGFFMCPSSLISYPGFTFPLCLPRGTPFLSQNSLAPG